MENLYNIFQRNGSDAYTGLIEDFTQYSPEYSQIPVITRAGTTYKTLSRTALPTAGFRLANQALTGSSSTWAQRVHEMFYVNTLITIDRAIYSADDGITGDLLYQEAQGGLQSVINTIANQTYYGNPPTDNSNGFVGLRQQLNAVGQTAITASAANNTTTVYGLWLGPQGVSYSVGKYGEIAFPPFQEQLLTTGQASNGSPLGFRGFWTSIEAWIGLSVASLYSVFGVTGVSLTAPFTDTLATTLLATNVPLVRRNGFTWFMNKTAQASLQKSRTAINYQPAQAANGSPAWSPPPTVCEGFPIVVTEALTNTENNA